MHYLRKSKIRLLFKIFIFICILIYILYSFYTREDNSKYTNKDTIIIGKVTSIKQNDDYIRMEIRAKEKILGTYYFKNDINVSDINLGDTFLFEGSLDKAASATTNNTFSYHNYLLSKKIYWTYTINKFTLIKKNSSILYKIKNKIYNHIKDMPRKEYFYTFILGDKSFLEPNILTMWQKCGISHLIAVSGMHLGLILIILNKIFSFLPVKVKNVFSVSFLFTYAFLVGFTPSVMRAFALIFGKMSFNKVSNKKLIVYFLLLFLIYNPYYIYDSGFLFSFTITFFLVNLEFKKKSNYIKQIIFISWISFLVGIPIVAVSFYEVNFLSIVANAIMVPFVSIVVFPLCLLSFFITPLNNIFKGIIYILELIVNFINKYLKYTVIIPRFPLFLVIIYYLFMYYIIVKQKYMHTIIILFLIYLYSYIGYVNPFFEVNVFDVGQGDSILLKFPYNKGNILIDTGGIMTHSSKGKYYITKNILLPYFKSIGITKIDFLILTHGDNDHMGEAINLVDNFKVENVIFNCGEFNNLETELIKVLEKKNIKYYSCIKELNIDNNKLYFLQTKEYDNENDNSNVIYTELNGYKFMFMGDAGVDKEKNILDKYNLSDIDVLKVGHHGSKTSSSKNFIDEIKPKYSIISVGKNNRYGHPNKEVLNNLENSKIYRTDQDGSIMFKIKNDKLEIEKCSP